MNGEKKREEKYSEQVWTTGIINQKRSFKIKTLGCSLITLNEIFFSSEKENDGLNFFKSLLKLTELNNMIYIIFNIRK